MLFIFLQIVIGQPKIEKVIGQVGPFQIELVMLGFFHAVSQSLQHVRLVFHVINIGEGPTGSNPGHRLGFRIQFLHSLPEPGHVQVRIILDRKFHRGSGFQIDCGILGGRAKGAIDTKGWPYRSLGLRSGLSAENYV